MFAHPPATRPLQTTQGLGWTGKVFLYVEKPYYILMLIS